MNGYMMPELWILALMIGLIVCGHDTGDAPADIRLLRHLTKAENYDIRSRPLVNLTDRVRVGISVEINRINHLDEKSEVFSWVGYVNTTWNNPRLKWNPAEWGGLEYLLMKENDMWVPDISILERLDADVGFTEQKRRLITVTHLGDVKWFLGGGMIDTPCKLDMQKFPFDSQSCGMSVGSYVMSDREVEIYHSNATMIGEHLGTNGMWTVTSFDTEMKPMVYDTKTGRVVYNYLYLSVHLERKSSYYVINIILPCIMISVLICVVFLIPPDGGDKVAFSVTLLVAFNVIQLVIIDMMPQTSESISIIAIYVTTLLALSGLCIPLSVFVINVHKGDGHLPRWLAKLILHDHPITSPTKNQLNNRENELVTGNGTFGDWKRNESPELVSPDGNEKKRLLEEIRFELQKLRIEQQERTKNGCRLEASRNAARRLDSLFLMFFAPILFLHTMTCLILMMS